VINEYYEDQERVCQLCGYAWILEQVSS